MLSLYRTSRRNTVLLNRLKRLNNTGLAEEGELFKTIDGINYLSLPGFKTLLFNANLKDINLPFFNPLRNVVRKRKRGLLFQGTSFQRAVLSYIGVDELNRRLPGADLLHFVFHSCNLNDASLDNAQHCTMDFTECSMIGTNFQGFHYTDYPVPHYIDDDMDPDFVFVIRNCDATRTNFSESNMSFLFLSESNFEYANFSNSIFRDESRFITCNFKNANFSNSVIDDYNDGFTFKTCNFENANFSNSQIGLATFTTCNLKNVVFAYMTIESLHFVKCDLNSVDFSMVRSIQKDNDCGHYNNKYLSFNQCKLGGMLFDNPDLLFNSSFIKCDFTGIEFGNTILSYDEGFYDFRQCTKDGLPFPPPPPADYRTLINNENILLLVYRYLYQTSYLPPDLVNKKINFWDVSKVTKMIYLFAHSEDFNEELNLWDVSKVTDMTGMFYYCPNFNKPLQSWDVRNVENMNCMFQNCTSFNKSLDKWKVSSVEDAVDMFKSCKSLNQNFDSWAEYLSATVDIKDIFFGCDDLLVPPEWSGLPPKPQEFDPPKEWTPADYANCDNNAMEYEDGEENDPLLYKEDHIWAEPLKTGKDMVVYNMLDSHGKKVIQNCHNRDRVQMDFDRQLNLDVRKPLTDYYKIPITKRFFDENGGFTKKYTRAIGIGGKRKKNNKITKKKRKGNTRRRTKKYARRRTKRAII